MTKPNKSGKPHSYNHLASTAKGRAAHKALRVYTSAVMADEQIALTNPHELYQFDAHIQKQVVAMLVCCGTPIRVLSVFLRMTEGTVMAQFGEVLTQAKELANGRVAASLFNTALYEADPRARTTAAIFWLKAQARWRDDGGTAANPDKDKLPDAFNLDLMTPEQIEDLEALVKRAKKRDVQAANDPQKLLEHETISFGRKKANGKSHAKT